MIQFEQPKTVEQVAEKINARIYTAEQNLLWINTVLDVLKKFEGKKITKRIETALKARPEMKGLIIYYGVDYGQYRLSIWGNGRGYNDRFTLTIDNKPGQWRNGCDTVDLERVKENAKCYTLEEGRIKEMKAGLESVPELVERWNKGLDELQHVHKNAKEYGTTIGYIFDFINNN